jgi:hypothetical protein
MSRALLCSLLLLGLACAKKPNPAAAPVAGNAAPGALEVPPLEEVADEVKPVYAAFEGAALPLARELCSALHDLPEARRAACCAAQKGTAMTGECTRIVSAALRSGSVELDGAAVGACVSAQERALSGCSWVGQWLAPLPPECRGLLRGRRRSGDLCRSSLECGEGQRCLGAGPTDAGRCGPPRSEGQACLSSVDPLAVYTLDPLDAHHPECAGWCGHRQCMRSAAPGASCRLARECGRGQHCDGEKCVAGASAAAGEKCVADACAPGLRCLSGRCAEPGPDGAACAADSECRGGCLPDRHLCGMRCDVR